MQKAFTLIELLVVISIIALLVSLILPALTHGRYAARIVLCQSQMKQMVMGFSSYATDYVSYYPDGAMGRPNPAMIFWNGSNGNHTAGGPGDFNFRPVFREYFGTDLNAIMICPLASPWWQDRTGLSNLDHTGPHAGMVKAPYGMYFGQESHTVYGPLSDKADHGWARSNYMHQMGQTWSPASAPQLNFDVLLSDFAYWNGFGGEYLLTTHQAPGNTVPHGGNWTNVNEGYMYPWEKLADANFARSDGSVSTYKINLESTLDGSLTGIRRQVGAQTHVIPTKLAR